MTCSVRFAVRLGIVLWLVGFAAIEPRHTLAQGSDSSMKILAGRDAVRGEEVFRQKNCFSCHSYDNWGGMFGPDLGSNRIRGASPSSLAAAMWNQAPAMWRQIRGETVTGSLPVLSMDESAALFAFFYARLYFNDLVESPHGEDLFNSRCSSCHDLRQTGSSKSGPPVASWGAIKDPTMLVGRMWNHSTDMLDQTLRAGKSWPRLSAQDATDILAYLWRLPELAPGPSPFRFGNDVNGLSVFGAQCGVCHTLGRRVSGRVALDSKLRDVTVPQLAAMMWNHAPAMKRNQPGRPLPKLSEADARDLVTYLVVARAFEESGNSARGESVFKDKNCNACHGGRLNAGAPPVTAIRGPFNSVKMTSVLFSHGPKMLDLMESKGIAWPRFRGSQMLDLLAYLNKTAAK